MLSLLLPLAPPPQTQGKEKALELIRSVGVNQEHEAIAGICRLPDGRMVRLVGLCDQVNRTPPWDVSGRPLQGWSLKDFKDVIDDELSTRPWISADRETGKIDRALAFILKGPSRDALFSRPEFEGTHSSKVRYSGDPIKGGHKEICGVWRSFDAKSRATDFFLDLDGPTKVLATVNEAGPHVVDGFDFSIESRNAGSWIELTKTSKKEIPLLAFRVTVEAPEELASLDLDIETNDVEPKRSGTDPGPMLIGMLAQTLPSSTPGYKSFVFVTQAIKKSGFKRTFTILAKTKVKVHFKNVPLYPSH
jgi:hypothetical protein